MVVYRSHAAGQIVKGQLRCFGNALLPLQDNIKVLGVTYIRPELLYDQHTASVAHPPQDGRQLDPQGIMTLYKAQIQPCMEYGALL